MNPPSVGRNARNGLSKKRSSRSLLGPPARKAAGQSGARPSDIFPPRGTGQGLLDGAHASRRNGIRTPKPQRGARQPAREPAIEISVIVATWNRAESLRDTLLDLARQVTHERFTYEVIVADNNSTDHTRAVVEALQPSYPVSLRYLFEARQGKGYALNRALEVARGAFIAFTDDDVVVGPSWLAVIHQTFERNRADGVGGPVAPRWIGRRPRWLGGQILRQLGVTNHGTASFVVTSPKTTFVGANAAYRRALFAQCGGFDLTDPAEDCEWFLRVFVAGFRLVYQPAAIVEHKIYADRVTRKAVARRFFRQGLGYGMRLQTQFASRTLCRIPYWMLRHYVDLHWQALCAWMRGDAHEAWWRWLERETYRGAMTRCFQDWCRWRPIARRSPSVSQALGPCPISRQRASAGREPEATDVTVIIATWNRAQFLEETLRDLARQVTGDRFTYDVIVVDNNSTDETKCVVEALRPSFPVELTHLFEGRQGKGYALNRALAIARGEVVAFTDDDVALQPTWLSALHRTFQEHHADGVGGPVRPLWIGTRPAWLSDDMLNQLGMRDYGPSTFHVEPGKVRFIGPNMAFRRALFARYGGFSPSELGQDADWFLRVLRHGHRLVYQPAACVQHKIDTARLTERAFAQRLFRHGRGYGIWLQEQPTGRTICRISYWVIRLYFQLHAGALWCWLKGDVAQARWQWFRRHIYHGVVVQCLFDWYRGTPLPRSRPVIVSLYAMPAAPPAMHTEAAIS